MLALYTFLTSRLTFVFKRYLRQRLRKGKEEGARLYERFGGASLPRPPGPLLWVHGASVGESLSVLKLLTCLKELIPDLQVLMTTGTVTSAQILQTRLPAWARHQYVPLDVKQWGQRFLKHWRPDTVIILESEFWPNLLQAVKENNIPLLLLNARLSQRSYRRWSLFKRTAKKILSLFDVCLTPNPETAERLQALGAQNVKVSVNLKFASDELNCQPTELEQFKNLISDRPVWAAVSTHDGEEEHILACHHHLKQQYPNLLTILVPRHPQRSAAIATLIAKAGVTACYRSRDEVITPQTELYVVDTIGELGLVYRLASLIFMGGSLVPIGGHNPIEAIKLGCLVINGPHTFNFKDVNDVLGKTLIHVATAEEVSAKISYYFENTSEMQALIAKGQLLGDQQQAGINPLSQEIAGYIHGHYKHLHKRQ